MDRLKTMVACVLLSLICTAGAVAGYLRAEDTTSAVELPTPTRLAAYPEDILNLIIATLAEANADPHKSVLLARVTQVSHKSPDNSPGGPWFEAGSFTVVSTVSGPPVVGPIMMDGANSCSRRSYTNCPTELRLGEYWLLIYRHRRNVSSVIRTASDSTLDDSLTIASTDDDIVTGFRRFHAWMCEPSNTAALSELRATILDHKKPAVIRLFAYCALSQKLNVGPYAARGHVVPQPSGSPPVRYWERTVTLLLADARSPHLLRRAAIAGIAIGDFHITPELPPVVGSDEAMQMRYAIDAVKFTTDRQTENSASEVLAFAMCPKFPEALQALQRRAKFDRTHHAGRGAGDALSYLRLRGELNPTKAAFSIPQPLYSVPPFPTNSLGGRLLKAAKE